MVERRKIMDEWRNDVPAKELGEQYNDLKVRKISNKDDVNQVMEFISPWYQEYARLIPEYASTDFTPVLDHFRETLIGTVNGSIAGEYYVADILDNDSQQRKLVAGVGYKIGVDSTIIPYLPPGEDPNQAMQWWGWYKDKAYHGPIGRFPFNAVIESSQQYFNANQYSETPPVAYFYNSDPWAHMRGTYHNLGYMKPIGETKTSLGIDAEVFSVDVLEATPFPTTSEAEIR